MNYSVGHFGSFTGVHKLKPLRKAHLENTILGLGCVLSPNSLVFFFNFNVLEIVYILFILKSYDK